MMSIVLHCLASYGIAEDLEFLDFYCKMVQYCHSLFKGRKLKFVFQHKYISQAL